MANRIIIGERAGDYGIFISRPGVDVLTATGSQLLLDTTRRPLQLVQTGALILNGSFTTVAFPNLGFKPVILWSTDYNTGSLNGSFIPLRLYFPSATTFNVCGSDNGCNVTYGITNLPVDAF
ncbi:hypothetical protein [Mesorhizobium sp. M0843]|uniref:hypothetical protein n=1 Tax=Mesorhizobium sp. M0843 TaxID=2957010 RepID=UPI003336C6F3